jgi:hypothetical protein
VVGLKAELFSIVISVSRVRSFVSLAVDRVVVTREQEVAPMTGQLIDDGLTCTTRDELQFRRDVKFNNGSGFDELDACAASLGYENPLHDTEEVDEFGDPEAYWIAMEEE